MRISDWSSDVCSSDLVADADAVEADPAGHRCADLGIGQVQLGGPHVRLCNLQVGTGDPELLDALVVGLGRDVLTVEQLPCPGELLPGQLDPGAGLRQPSSSSEEHTSELQSLMRK